MPSAAAARRGSERLGTARHGATQARRWRRGETLNPEQRPAGSVSRPPRVAVLANCASGGAAAIEERTRQIVGAFEATGVSPEVRCVASKDIERIARQLAAEKPDALVAAGGDGTVSAVAGALVGTRIPLGVLAMGTLNHFAKDVGIPLDLAGAAAAIVAGRTVPVDAASVNDRVFVNNSSLGLYPQLVLKRDARRARRGGSKRLATLRTSLAVLRKLPLARVALDVDGRTESIATPLLFIGNNAYALEGRALGKRTSLQGGKLTVAHTRRAGAAGMGALALRALAGALDGADDLTLLEAQRVVVHAHRAHLRVALDGEVVTMRPPLEYRALPAALRVLVPEKAP